MSNSSTISAPPEAQQRAACSTSIIRSSPLFLDPARRMADEFDCVIVGGGPAGLSAALNLARSRSTVLVIDSNRPRNAPTLSSHGFITRDGIPPNELRKLARAELDGYPEVEFAQRSAVTLVARDREDGHPFSVQFSAGTRSRAVLGRTVLLASGLRETLPDIPSVRGYYGMSLFSCVAC